MPEDDSAFMVGTAEENPIAYHLHENFKGLLEITPRDDRSREALTASNIGYTIAGVAELERKVLVLEGIVRDLMAR